MFPFEGDLDNLGPAEGVDLDARLEDNEADAGDAELDVSSSRVLARVQRDPVHLQPLCMLQKVHLRLRRTLPFVELVQLGDLPVQLLGGRKSSSWAGAVAPQRLQANDEKEERLKREKAVLRGYTTCWWAEVMAAKRIGGEPDPHKNASRTSSTM